MSSFRGALKTALNSVLKAGTMTRMTLFLLTAVPLAAIVAHRFLYPQRRAFEDVWLWIRGGVWATASLVVAAWFGQARLFTGDLSAVFFGLTFTDVILVPGGVVAAWILTKRRDLWELGVWIALALTLAGLRDFVSATRTYDLSEYFLIPLARVLVLLLLPELVVKAVESEDVRNRSLWTTAAAAVGLSGSLVPVLSYANLGWLVWALELGGLAALVWRRVFQRVSH